MFMYVVVGSIFATSYIIFYLLFSLFFNNRRIILMRLAKIEKLSAGGRENELDLPLFSRIIKPMLDNISKVILRITPKEIISMMEKRVAKAGKPYGLSVKDWINIQVIALLCFPLITTTLAYYRDAEMDTILSILLFEVVLAAVMPSLILNRKIIARQKQITNSLPDILDLLTVSVEAGLSFDGALAKVIDKMPGPLADEFNTVLQEIKVGKQKKDALKDMAERVEVQDLTTFVSSVVQAEQLGVSIGNVLRLQAEQMRLKRRQRAQEKAMKAPVKMLIPMVLFIFPTIFSVLLGPVVIKVVRTLLK